MVREKGATNLHKHYHESNWNIQGEGIEMVPPGHHAPVLNKKATSYPTLNVFGRGLVNSRKQEKRRHISGAADTTGTVRHKPHTETYPITPQGQQAAAVGVQSGSFAKKFMRKLKDKLPALRKGNAKQDTEEYYRNYKVGTWSDIESIPVAGYSPPPKYSAPSAPTRRVTEQAKKKAQIKRRLHKQEL